MVESTTYQLTVSDIRGRMIAQESVVGSYGTIDMSRIDAGIYVLTVSSKERILGSKRISVN